MQHLGTTRLETNRLILRRFVPEDAPAMFRNWASDPEVTRFLTWPTHESETVTRKIVAQWTASYENPEVYQWAIVAKACGEPIGSISVVSHNNLIQKAEVGYCIGRAWWHQGIASEALSAVIGFLFREVGMRRVEARHDVQNPHSGAVMQKCGMRLEGTLRQSDWNNQGICDTKLYAILAQDFFRNS